MARKSLERETSPVRTKIWVEPKPKATEEKVPVIYYLSRNGQLEHPHLMEVPLSSPQGILCLKDVTNRLNILRGQGMANMHSWSAKRSYKNGFVWQDISENDFIYPCNGHEYVLKGSQLIESSLSFRSYEKMSPPTSKGSFETNSSSTDTDSPASIKRKKNQSWSSCDYQVYKATTCREFAVKASNASTQTEKLGKQRATEKEQVEDFGATEASELKEIPFSGSGLGELEGSLECSGSADIRAQTVENEHPSGRMKVSTVLMQMISCVSSKRFED